MQNLAEYADYLLYMLVALTCALVLYKAIHLYVPSLLKKRAPGPKASDLDREAYVESLEGGMTMLAAIASAAPFVGLGATVMHIMVALSRMSSGQVDIMLISGPIATALNSTLIGLAAAVPALVGYNLMQRRIQVVHNRLRRTAAQNKNAGEEE